MAADPRRINERLIYLEETVAQLLIEFEKRLTNLELNTAAIAQAHNAVVSVQKEHDKRIKQLLGIPEGGDAKH